MTRWFCLLLCHAFLGASAQVASTQGAPVVTAPGAPTIDQSLEMVSVTAPSVSPDGTRVVFQQSRTNWDGNAFEDDLWLVSTRDPKPHRLTAPNKSAVQAAWSPDGRWIAFVSDRPGVIPKSPAEKRQIYLASADGGEGVQLTHTETDVDHFEWSPDSKSIAFTCADPDPQKLKDRKESFGEYHIIHGDYDMAHIWLVDVPEDPGVTTPAPVKITDGSFSVGDFKFAPDGKQIAFSAQRDPDRISAFTADIYTVTLAGHTVKKIVETAGPDEDPHWSPDGRQIAFVTANGDPHFFYTNNRIAIVPSDGSAKPVVVDEAFDEDASLAAWSAEGIYFTGFEHGTMRLFRLDPVAKSVAAVSPEHQYITAVSISPDGRHVAYRGATAEHMPEIDTAALGSANAGATNPDAWVPVQLTHINNQLAPYARSTREIVTWKSGDGAEIEGVLEKPANFQPGVKYPLLVIIHGGPTGLDTPVLAPDRYYPAERFLARGALVLRPNYRGSAGYGGKFRALNVRNLGVGDYADVISGVDSLIAKGMVDPKRVGAMGWSEGGYISAFITASSDRFVAVSVGAGISDWATYYYNTDITPFTRQYLDATPQSDPEIYKKTSPINYISHARTPTLIQQGSADHRVPVANSFELRQALEDRGVPVKMVLYEGFGHPITKPKQQRAVMEENELWFNHYIWGDPLPADLTPVAKAKEDKK